MFTTPIQYHNIFSRRCGKAGLMDGVVGVVKAGQEVNVVIIPHTTFKAFRSYAGSFLP
ncbi:MAG: hypothetical protein ABIQ77_04295 [Anaerolineales bacterium]